jgi:endo-1,3(4)-beta-glucanase
MTHFFFATQEERLVFDMYNRDMTLAKKIMLFITILLLFLIGGFIYFTSVGRSLLQKNGLPKRATGKSSTQAMQGIVTNQWYSSLFFKDWSEQMFAFPLAYKLEAKGLGISYPRISASERTVFGSYTEDLFVSLEQPFTKKTVVTPDMITAGLELCSAQGKCVETRLAHGSPVTVFIPKQDTSLVITAPTMAQVKSDQKFWTLEFTHAKYLVGVKNAEFIPLTEIAKQDAKTISFSLKENEQLFVVLLPDNGSISESDLGASVTGAEFHYSAPEEKITGNGRVISRITYLSDESAKKPLVALLPHQWQHQQQPSLGSYKTLRGEMKLYAINEIESVLPEPQPLTVEKMISALDEKEKARLAKLVEEATKEVTQIPVPNGVYDAGKFVFRLAQLLEISEALKAPTSEPLRQRLTQILSEWLSAEPSSTKSPFTWKESPKGLIARQEHAQFGNEDFNDHHFHYGYYLAAAGILLDTVEPDQRTQLYTSLKPGLDAMTLDISNLDPAQGYPLLRNFDAYESHSWADGRALAGDGNNQESTSEAVNRWYGLYRFASATQHTELLKIAKAGWAMESEAAQIYWLGQRPELFKFPEGYKHPIASLVWGGKYDFSTWFSGLPSHIYGIQFLPISPAMTHVRNTTRWSSYGGYGLSEDTQAWNDLYFMVAVANGQKEVNGQAVPTELKKYEAGNSAPWYYLWVSYWLKQ